MSYKSSSSLSLLNKTLRRKLSKRYISSNIEDDAIQHNNCAPMLSLPDELWFMILSMLYIEDLLHISRVCRELYRVVRDERLWSHHLERRWGDLSKLQIQKPEGDSTWKTYNDLANKVSKYKEYKIVIVGYETFDKSLLSLKFLKGMVTNFAGTLDPASEDRYRKKLSVDGRTCLLEVMTNPEEYRALRDHYIKSAEGFLLLFSVYSRASFETIQKIRCNIKRILAESRQQFPMILLGCSQGEEGDDSPTRAVSHEQAQEIADDWDIPYLETTYSSEEMQKQAFVELVRMIDRSRLVRSQNDTPLSCEKKLSRRVSWKQIKKYF